MDASALGGWTKGNEQPVSWPRFVMRDIVDTFPCCRATMAVTCFVCLLNELQFTDEEVTQQYEEFYEDVHSEFLQFGELVNFKVCNNASAHLRGNLYVQFKSEASAQAAYNALNGRYYAAKQITCEFVGVTRWRVALCGEYVKGRRGICSHGTTCNFLHCFRNPRGEYDWADWDSPRPRFWIERMAKLFGYENLLADDLENRSKDEGRRHHGSPDSPQYRESRNLRRRGIDRYEYSIEGSDRHRRYTRHESRSGRHGSDPQDRGRSSRHRKNHSRRDARHHSASNEVDDRGRGNDCETMNNGFADESESSAEDYDDWKGDVREKRQKRHKSDTGDIKGEAFEDSRDERQMNSRNRNAYSYHEYKGIDKDSKYRYNHSRDFDDSDRRQSLDLRSSRGRSNTSEKGSQTDKDVPQQQKYSEVKTEIRTCDKKRGGSVDHSDSSDDNDTDYSRRRHRGYRQRYREGRTRRSKPITQDQLLQREVQYPKINDRWTGTTDP